MEKTIGQKAEEASLSLKPVIIVMKNGEPIKATIVKVSLTIYGEGTGEFFLDNGKEVPFADVLDIKKLE